MKRAAALLVLLGTVWGPKAAHAQQVEAGAPALEPVRSITVSGTGVVQRVPDQAMLSLAVETLAPNARAAAQQNAQHMDAVVRAIRAAGIPGERIRTTSYNLNPEYQYIQPTPGHPGEQKLTGYRASNTVEVTIDSIPRVGGVLDAAIAAGANRANGIRYQLRDPDAARRDALRAAVANARADAQAVAEAAGQPLGVLLQLSTGSYAPPPMPMFEAARKVGMAADAVPTPVEPGELEIRATVTAVYRLAGPAAGR